MGLQFYFCKDNLMFREKFIWDGEKEKPHKDRLRKAQQMLAKYFLINQLA